VLKWSSGIALRFPQFLRFRDDNEAEQATTVREILRMYQIKVTTRQGSARHPGKTLLPSRPVTDFRNAR
jgi:hypothetical protein